MAEVFVFGSNLAGRHGAGSALEARKNWGAIYGQGEGRQGNSYAIPTKDENLKVLPLYSIHRSVQTFLQYALYHSEDRFKVVAIGTGLAGYPYEAIAPMFRGAPSNVWLPVGFERILKKTEE